MKNNFHSKTPKKVTPVEAREELIYDVRHAIVEVAMLEGWTDQALAEILDEVEPRVDRRQKLIDRKRLRRKLGIREENYDEIDQ